MIPTDADGDGYYAVGSCGDPSYLDDCNDADGTINPGAFDTPYDGIDQDCSGADMTYPDVTSGQNCTWCHGAATSWDGLHTVVTAPDASCATCHNPEVSNVLPGHYGNTVLTDGNNMTAGAIIDCASCHDLNAANHTGGNLGSATNFVWSKVVKGSTTCDNCHENRAAGHTTDAAHNNRIIDTTCATCHTSDNSVLGSPGTGTLVSAVDVDALHGSDCALCHNYTGVLMNAAVIRDVISQGVAGTQISCLDCHIDKVNHVNPAHTVSVDVINDLSYAGQPCSDCHVVATWAEIEGVEHNVATNGAGSCATCHNSSRPDVIATIAAKANPTSCLACHADKYMTVHGDADHVNLGYVTGGSTYCIGCHDTGAAVNGTVVTTHLNNCSLCHTTVPNLQSGLPAGGGDCSACHTNTWELTHISNPPDHTTLVQVGSTVCANCHSTPPPLTDNADSKVHNTCGSCHDSLGGLIGSAAVANKTLADIGDCQTCHIDTWEGIHTTAPNHGMIVTVGSTTCATCHDD
ncbi:putative metal-binding motif-containing protein, partial [Malonomonas rubra]|uniref:putative metal-binding motif-containing protein n=1 Tax=Malonomonas rubra TaxID=57040 RepID=UPI0026EFDF9D